MSDLFEIYIIKLYKLFYTRFYITILFIYLLIILIF